MSFFDGYITVPISNEKNQISDIYGRRFNASDSRDVDHLYLPSTLIQCFRWAYKRGYLLINPAQHLQLPKAMKKLPVILSVTEMQAVLNAPDLETPYGIRDRALLEVFYATGY